MLVFFRQTCNQDDVFTFDLFGVLAEVLDLQTEGLGCDGLMYFGELLSYTGFPVAQNSVDVFKGVHESMRCFVKYQGSSLVCQSFDFSLPRYGFCWQKPGKQKVVRRQA